MFHVLSSIRDSQLEISGLRLVQTDKRTNEQTLCLVLSGYSAISKWSGNNGRIIQSSTFGTAYGAGYSIHHLVDPRISLSFFLFNDLGIDVHLIKGVTLYSCVSCLIISCSAVESLLVNYLLRSTLYLIDVIHSTHSRLEW